MAGRIILYLQLNDGRDGYFYDQTGRDIKNVTLTVMSAAKPFPSREAAEAKVKILAQHVSYYEIVEC